MIRHTHYQQYPSFVRELSHQPAGDMGISLAGRYREMRLGRLPPCPPNDADPGCRTARGLRHYRCLVRAPPGARLVDASPHRARYQPEHLVPAWFRDASRTTRAARPERRCDAGHHGRHGAGSGTTGRRAALSDEGAHREARAADGLHRTTRSGPACVFPIRAGATLRGSLSDTLAASGARCARHSSPRQSLPLTPDRPVPRQFAPRSRRDLRLPR